MKLAVRLVVIFSYRGLELAKLTFLVCALAVVVEDNFSVAVPTTAFCITLAKRNFAERPL